MTKHTEQLSTYKALMLDTEAIELLKKLDTYLEDVRVPDAEQFRKVHTAISYKFYQLAKNQGVI